MSGNLVGAIGAYQPVLWITAGAQPIQTGSIPIEMPRIRAASIAQHKTQTRVEMLDAAAALFTAQGYMETSLGDVAGYVGVGRTTLYEYFADKEDLLASLVESRIPGVIDDLIDGLPESATVREQLAELMIRALEFITSVDNLGTILMRETPRLGPESQDRIRTSHRRLEDEITALCRRGIESGEFRAFDVEEVSRLVFSVMWSASRTLLHDSDAKQRRHEAAETVVRFVFDGLAV